MLWSRPSCGRGEILTYKLKSRKVPGVGTVYDVVGDEVCIKKKRYVRKRMELIFEIGGHYYPEKVTVYCHPVNKKPLYISVYSVERLMEE